MKKKSWNNSRRRKRLNNCEAQFVTVSRLSEMEIKHDCDLTRDHEGPHYCRIHDTVEEQK